MEAVFAEAGERIGSARYASRPAVAVIMEMTHTKPNTKWPVRPIGELLRRVRQPVDVQLRQTYQEIGIRSHCKGIFHKTPTTGEEIGNKRVFWVEPGCLIFNIIFAWEQAVAMTSENETGMIASHRFPMYTSRNGKLLPEYAWRYFSSPRGKYDLGIASPGGAGRNKTLGQAEFDQLKIPVPPLAHQRMVVDTLASADRAIARTEDLIAAKRRLKEGFAEKMLSGVLRVRGCSEPWTRHKFGDFVSLSKTRFDPRNSQENRPCIELEHISQGDGRLIGMVDSQGQWSTKAVFEREDVLYGKLRPNLRKSYYCEFDGVCSTEIWVLKADPQTCCGAYLAELVQTDRFISAACVATGTKMPRADWRVVSEVSFVLPSVSEQKKIVAVVQAASRQLNLHQKKLTKLRRLREGLMQKLLPSEPRVEAS